MGRSTRREGKGTRLLSSEKKKDRPIEISLRQAWSDREALLKKNDSRPNMCRCTGYRGFGCNGEGNGPGSLEVLASGSTEESLDRFSPGS